MSKGQILLTASCRRRLRLATSGVGATRAYQHDRAGLVRVKAGIEARLELFILDHAVDHVR
jgi:hypothetical protein